MLLLRTSKLILSAVDKNKPCDWKKKCVASLSDFKKKNNNNLKKPYFVIKYELLVTYNC